MLISKKYSINTERMGKKKKVHKRIHEKRKRKIYRIECIKGEICEKKGKLCVSS